MERQSYHAGGLTFRSLSAWRREVKSYLTTLGPLSAEAYEVTLRYLEQHPEWNPSWNVVRIQVIPASRLPQAKPYSSGNVFWLILADGVGFHLSYKDCEQHARYIRWAREVIRPTIETFKRRFCPRGTYADSDVDHCGEWPFARIAREFREREHISLDTFRPTLALERSFLAFHDVRATLRIIARDEHRRRQ